VDSRQSEDLCWCRHQYRDHFANQGFCAVIFCTCPSFADLLSEPCPVSVPAAGEIYSRLHWQDFTLASESPVQPPPAVVTPQEPLSPSTGLTDGLGAMVVTAVEMAVELGGLVLGELRSVAEGAWDRLRIPADEED